MKTKAMLLIGLTSLMVSLSSNAQLLVIEPDHYADHTTLDFIAPQVRLVTADANNQPMPFFPITALTENSPGYAPTGTKVFGIAGVGFFNDNWRLRMNFTQPADYIALAFGGGNYFYGETARLDAFSNDGSLLASYTSQPLTGGSFETLTLSRPTADIAWAVAYLPPDGGSFARFDRLEFSVVPEPSKVAFLALTAAVFAVRPARARG
jgi:hypothetical protein